MTEPDKPWTLVASTTLGTGADIVLLPGLAVSRYLQQSQRLLSEHTRVHLLEYPGTGRAPDPPSSWPALGLAEDADAVAGWLEAHIDEHGGVVLVGHSYGTQVAVRATALVLSKVRSLVLISPTVDPAYRSWPRLLTRWLVDSRREPRSLADFQRPEQRRAGALRGLAMVRSMLDDDIDAGLDRATVPAVIVRGERDALCRREWACRLAGRTAGEFVDVPGAPHAFPYDHPAATCDVILGGLERTKL